MDRAPLVLTVLVAVAMAALSLPSHHQPQPSATAPAPDAAAGDTAGGDAWLQVEGARRAAWPCGDLTTHRDVHALREFVRRATAADAASLRDLALHSSEPLAAGNALRALAVVADIRGDSGLLALLSDPRLRVRQEATLAFGRARDATAVAALVALLADEHVRALALSALANIGTPEAASAIRAALRDPRARTTDAVFATSPR